MKKLLLLIIPALLLALAGCSNVESGDKERQEKNDKKSTQKQDKTSTEQTEQKSEEIQQNEQSDDINVAKPINEMTKEEYDKYLLTQKRSYLTKEQQERYDYLLETKGSSPGENDEKNKKYNKQQKEALESNKGGTALITPPETEKEKEELRKKQQEQLKQREQEQLQQPQQQQAPTEQRTQQVPTERDTPEHPEQKRETIEK